MSTCPDTYGPQCLADQPGSWWTAPPIDTTTLPDTGTPATTFLMALAIVLIAGAILAFTLEVRQRRANRRRATAIETAARKRS